MLHCKLFSQAKRKFYEILNSIFLSKKKINLPTKIPWPDAIKANFRGTLLCIESMSFLNRDINVFRPFLPAVLYLDLLKNRTCWLTICYLKTSLIYSTVKYDENIISSFSFSLYFFL